MVTTDTIADMLTRIRNANLVKHQIVQVPSTKITVAIAKVLRDEGFIADFDIFKDDNGFPLLILSLKYKGRKRQSVLTNLKRISKPGLRIYSGYRHLPSVFTNTGIAIVSTSKGVMTEKQAKQQKVGGEILCYVW